MKQTAALYLRLSQADEEEAELYGFPESQSIQNQRQLLMDYLNSHEEFSSWEVIEFVDDGFSGKDGMRPQFQKMLGMAKNHELNLVLVKDFSRLARNYILMGDIVEQFFPSMGVRFISVNDHYDSAASTQADDMSRVLKSVLHAYYSKELSDKLRKTAEMKMRRGLYCGNAPFGYVFNEDRTKFLIDPEAAETVREIFRLALAGHPAKEIARILTETGYAPPTVYNLSHNNKKPRTKNTPEQDFWKPNSILHILHNPVYIGTLQMNLEVHVYPASRHLRTTKPEERVVFEDAHEAIISKEEFDRVQELFPKSTATPSVSKTQYPLKSHVFCGGCKHTMERYCSRPWKFYCRHHAVNPNRCTGKRYTESELEETVLHALLPMLRLLEEKADGDASLQALSQDWLSSCQEKLRQQRIELGDVKSRKLALYESYLAGTLALDSYRIQTDALSSLVRKLETDIDSLEAKELHLRAGLIPEDLSRLTEQAKLCRDASVLTAEMVNSFVDRIEIYDTHIKIQWKFQDIWDHLLEGLNGDDANDNDNIINDRS